MSSPKEHDVMAKNEATAAKRVYIEEELPSELSSVVSGALVELEDDCPGIVRSSFGIGGTEPASDAEIAESRGESEREIKELREDALRALMGYGPKARGKRVIV